MLHTVPTQPALRLDDGPLRLALRLRLGLPPRLTSSPMLRDKPTYGLDCNKSRALITKRRNAI